jgi:hypothetical protein
MGKLDSACTAPHRRRMMALDPAVRGLRTVCPSSQRYKLNFESKL